MPRPLYIIYFLVLVFVGGVVSSCDGALDPAITKAQDAVRYGLKDPDSAKFRDVKHCDKPDAIQGEVNAKNEYGGYTGFKSFIYADGETATLNEEADLDKWDRLTKKCWANAALMETSAKHDTWDNEFGNELNEFYPANGANAATGSSNR